MIEQLRSIVEQSAPATALAKLLGFRLTAVEIGAAVVEMQTGPEHANLFGGVHGGVLCSLVDSAMGIAHASTLGDGETFTTIDLQISFLRGVKIAHLTARGRIIKHGRNVSFAESEVQDDAGRVIAKASCTCLTIRHHGHAYPPR
ncbi:MAG TPA: PaaI family thioesterase [Bryobacteraceae bacterium]|nr:PaaI family thioesterase [Bryobacteraceae bacterium]